MYFSKNTGGFYAIEIHGDKIPGDAVEISDALHAELMHQQTLGKVIAPDGNGYPLAQDKVFDFGDAKKQKQAHLKFAASSAITSGVSSDALGAVHIYPTTKDDQAYLTARYSKAVALGPAGAPYKFMCADGNGVWARRDHTAEQIIAVSLAVEGHITAQLNKLDTLTYALAVAVDVAAIEAIVW